MALSKVGLEVYVTEKIEEEEEEEEEDGETTTDDDSKKDGKKKDCKNCNKKNNTKKKDTTKKKDSKKKTTNNNDDDDNPDEDSEEEEEETTNTAEITGDPSTNFTLENGPIIHIDYIGEVYSDSFEMDYTELTSNASVTVPLDYVDLFFKGKKMCMKKAWQKKDDLKWDKMATAVLGFCTELTWNRDKVDAKISGMDKLMDVEAQFNFTQTKRSEIVKQIIETAGLNAVVDTTGLVDDVTDFTNISSSGEDDDSEGYTGEVSADIAKAAKQICQGKKSCLDKAKAIWRWCHDEMSYEGYSNSQKGAEGCFKDRAGNCCDHANVVVQMLRAVGVKAAYEHSGTCYGTGHVWAVATCDGKDYRIDASVKSRDFDEVGDGCTGERLDNLDF